MTCDFPPASDDLPVMDYRGFQDNPGERGKVFRSLGYDADSFAPSASSNKAASSFSTDGLDALCSVLHSEVECQICKRKFVDQEGLKRHHATLHVGKQLKNLIRLVLTENMHMRYPNKYVLIIVTDRK